MCRHLYLSMWMLAMAPPTFSFKMDGMANCPLWYGCRRRGYECNSVLYWFGFVTKGGFASTEGVVGCGGLVGLQGVAGVQGCGCVYSVIYIYTLYSLHFNCKYLKTPLCITFFHWWFGVAWQQLVGGSKCSDLRCDSHTPLCYIYALGGPGSSW